MFDLTTHVRDSKSGRVIAENHYSKIVGLGVDGSPTELYERPPLSGIFYGADGQLDEARSKAGLERAASAKKEAEKTAEQRYNEEIEEARALLAKHAAKEREAVAARIKEKQAHDLKQEK